MFQKRKKKSNHKRAAASAVAAMTAAGVMVGGALSSPDDIMNDGPDAIVQTVVLNAQTGTDADGGDGDSGAADEIVVDDEEKRGLRSSMRKAVRSSPRRMRAAAAALWVLGTAAIALLSSLWAGALSPVAAAALSWLFAALLAVLVFTLAVKTVFPDMPLKKILSRRNLLGIGILCLVCGIADAALPFFWDDYAGISRLLKVLGTAVCTGVPIAFFLRRHKRAEPAETVEAEAVEAPPPEPTMEEKEAAARALVEELADSVCPRTY